MSYKSPLLFTMAAVGGSAILYSSSGFADSTEIVMKELEPIVEMIALDILAIDGVQEKERDIVKNIGGQPKQLSDEERQDLAKQAYPLLKQIEKVEANSAMLFIGNLVMLASLDGEQSQQESDAIETYRSILAASHSAEEGRNQMQKNIRDMQNRMKRAEVPTYMKGIKTALISYESEYDTYVSAEWYPPISPGLKTWKASESGGFKTLYWSPDSQVRGSYKVELDGTTNFRVTGVIDADEDGVYATYVATKSINPSNPITPKDVY